MTSLLRKPKFAPAQELRSADLVERLRWVIGIRWTVVIALLFIGLLGKPWQPDSGMSRAQLALAMLVSIYNFFFLSAIRRPDFGNTPFTRALHFVQMPLDLIAFTVIIHLSGGVTGPVFVLYFLYIFVGLAILPPVGAYYVAIISAICYGTLALIEMLWLPVPDSITTTLASMFNRQVFYLGYFLTVSATLLITAYIANYFAGLLTRDERTIRQQLHEMNTLYTFTQALSPVLSSSEVMQMLAQTALNVEGADSCSVATIGENEQITVVTSKGLTEEQQLRLQKRPLSFYNGPLNLGPGGSKGLYVPDVDKLSGLRPLLLRPETHSLYAIPILSESRLIGTLNLSFDKPYTMPISRWNLLNAMTQQASLAVERTKLFADSQRAAREMTGLYHIGLATTSSLQIDEVLRLIYEQVNRVLHPDTFYIALYDEDLAELRYDSFIENGEPLPPFKARLDNVGISGWVVRNRRPIFVRHWDAEIEQLPFEASVVGAPTQSVVSVPLLVKNRIIGVMSVQALASGVFDQHHLRLLTSIASQAALAIENAKLHTTVNEQAQRDSLTGVFNHGTFIDKLNTEIKRAQVENQSLALIMLDIDSFKQYNDTYGHLVGNDVLRSTVAAIQDHLKSVDVVGRWGGEEFAIMLPEVTRTQVRLVAERIKQTVAHNPVRDLRNRTIPSPTVSQGIAMYPQDATQLEELIDKADVALYRAKHMGRNQIAEWLELRTGQPIIP